jgi:glycine cleavage system T protein (aminomethyltransferase)
MPLEGGMAALRRSVALSSLDHVARVRVGGPAAFDLVNRVTPLELYARDGQMLHTVLLEPSAQVMADAYVCRDDEQYLILAEGPDSPALLEWLHAHIHLGERVELEDLGPSYDLFSLGGPYAWELMASWLGMGIMGLPYMGFARGDGWTCFRAGKTGEYGYDMLVPRERAPAFRERVRELGREYDLADLDFASLEQAMLEAFTFNIRREGRAGATPLELQLQWRISYEKDSIAAAALRERRAQGPKERLTFVRSQDRLGAGDAVTFGAARIGTVVNAGWSELLGAWVGTAMLGVAFAHSGVDRYQVGGRPLRTITPPALLNRSLVVNPQRHSYRTKDMDVFPPLVPER